MEFTPTSPGLMEDDQSNEESGMDIGALISKFLRHWKWFVLSFIICVLIGFYKLNFKRPLYEAVTTIEIKNDNNNDPGMGVFKQMGIMAGSKDKVADEMEIIKSKSLMAEVVKSLNLNVVSYSDKNFISEFLDENLGMSTDFYAQERYDNPPLKITFLSSDSIVHKISSSFFIKVVSEDEFTFLDAEKIISKKHPFGEKLTTNFGDIIITPNLNLKENSLIGETIVIDIYPLNDIVDYYAYNLTIERKSEFSHILSISIMDGTKQKAVDFLNSLVAKYNERAVNLKEELTQRTSDFVDNRLQKIERELSEVDLQEEKLKTSFRMSEDASQVGINMQSSAIIEGDILNADNQFQQTQYFKEYIKTTDKNAHISIDLTGVANNSILEQQALHNKLMSDKQKLLKNSTEKNPTVAKLTREIDQIKNTISTGLENLATNQSRKLNSLREQQSLINSRIYSAPKQERQVTAVERQQGIKEALFLVLLQKREETAVTLGVTDPNARIIDYAVSAPFPKSPKKKMYLLMAGMLGLILPAVLIYLRDMLDSKFHTREEVESQLKNIPIIGDIPKLETKGRYLIKKDDYSSIAEAFRILRTNLKFMLPKGKSTKGQVIFITSTIAHEGKSLVSTNLSAALAFGDKRTLLLGMDIRAPKIEAYLGAKGKVGVTNYVINPDLTPEDITISVPNFTNLDVISSGDLAPNPAELLMDERITELFDYAKDNYDYVIVDTAAYSMVTDTLLLSGFADAFIYVVRTNYLAKKQLKYVKSLYRDKRLPNMSVLINGIDAKKGYGYGYGYGYGTEFERTQKKRWWKFGS